MHTVKRQHFLYCDCKCLPMTVAIKLDLDSIKDLDSMPRIHVQVIVCKSYCPDTTIYNRCTCAPTLLYLDQWMVKTKEVLFSYLRPFMYRKEVLQLYAMNLTEWPTVRINKHAHFFCCRISLAALSSSGDFLTYSW